MVVVVTVAALCECARRLHTSSTVQSRCSSGLRRGANCMLHPLAPFIYSTWLFKLQHSLKPLVHPYQFRLQRREDMAITNAKLTHWQLQARRVLGFDVTDTACPITLKPRPPKPTPLEQQQHLQQQLFQRGWRKMAKRASLQGSTQPTHGFGAESYSTALPHHGFEISPRSGRDHRRRPGLRDISRCF